MRNHTYLRGGFGSITVAVTRGFAVIPIVAGSAAYYGYQYYKKRNLTATLLSRLAPCTTNATRSPLSNAL